MKRIESKLEQLTSSCIVEDLREVLREKDPEFPVVEEKFLRAVELAGRYINQEGMRELLLAWEQQACSDLLYAGFLGFQANLQNFHNPVASQFTQLDCETFLREHIMQTLPARADAEETIQAYQAAFPEVVEICGDDIRNYCIYLEVTGPKIAYFWGYQFANRFLPWVEPGYVSDGAQTSLYALELHQDLGFPVQ